MKKNIDWKERFVTKFVKSPNGCWNWITGFNTCGYGQFSINGHTLRAHRVSWVLHNGEIPKGLLVCHVCDNPKCVNPDHLFLGTVQDNVTDMINKKRKVVQFGDNHCFAKLNFESARQIRTIYAQGTVTQRQLAKQFNVTVGLISQVTTGKIWKTGQQNIRKINGVQTRKRRPGLNQNAKMRKDNTSGFTGVSFHKPANKWSASIQANKIQRRIGFFDTPEEAKQAYDKAKAVLHRHQYPGP